MGSDASGKGTVVILKATKTLGGVPQYLYDTPKDQDPISFEDLDIGDMELGANGNEISWSTSNPAVVTLSVAPNTKSHAILTTYFQANSGKSPIRDLFTLIRVMPNGSTFTGSKGRITRGAPGSGLSGEGKNKTVQYQFKFADYDDVVVPNLD